MIENTTDAIWSVDTSCRLIAANSVMKKHYLSAFGVTLQMGTNMSETISPSLRSKVLTP
jgi:hypothetical protein